MKRIAVVLVAAAMLAGCAGTEMQAVLLEQTGYMHVFEADRPDHDYKFYIKNVADIGWDADRRNDRMGAVQKYLVTECRSVSLVDEQFLPLGKYPSGSNRGQYIMRVKCDR